MKKIGLILFFSIVYAVARYVYFTPDLIMNVPVFVCNKAISMAGAITLVLGVWNRYAGRNEFSAMCFNFTVFAVVVHVPMSLSILDAVYFPEFYQFGEKKMKFFGETIVMFGATSLGLLWYVQKYSLPVRARVIIANTLMGTVLLHVLSMGICRGLNINAKHGYMPPMWLISSILLFCGILAVMYLEIFKKPAFKSKPAAGESL